jgi:hypothetical protein
MRPSAKAQAMVGRPSSCVTNGGRAASATRTSRFRLDRLPRRPGYSRLFGS